jgi:hypothetical protein
MDAESVLRDGLGGWQHREPPASAAVLRELASAAPVPLPDEYAALLRFSNGGEGQLAVEPGWFQLWPAEKVLEMNRGYAVNEFLPGFFGFGSNGGGELLALDLRSGPPFRVVMVPFIPMDVDEAVTVSETFAEFLHRLGRVRPE